MFEVLQDSFADIGLQFDPGKTTWLSLVGDAPVGDQTPAFVNSMTWLGIKWEKGDYKFAGTAARRKQLANAAQLSVISDVEAAELHHSLPSCRMVWIAMVMSHYNTMAPAWGMQHFKVRGAWNHECLRLLARFVRKTLGLSRHSSNIALAMEAGIWPPVVNVARRLDDLWATARDSDNVLLNAAVACEVEMCQRGRGKCWLKQWLKALQCGIEDIEAGRMGSKAEAACIRELDGYRNAPIHADACDSRHVAMYIQQFACVTPYGKVPKHHTKFRLHWKVIQQYIQIATGDMQFMPAYRYPTSRDECDIPFTERDCPFCRSERGSHICTVYHLLSGCLFRTYDTLDENDYYGHYIPDTSGTSMQQWIQNNYTADGIRYLVDSVSHFRAILA